MRTYALDHDFVKAKRNDWADCEPLAMMEPIRTLITCNKKAKHALDSLNKKRKAFEELEGHVQKLARLNKPKATEKKADE